MCICPVVWVYVNMNIILHDMKHVCVVVLGDVGRSPRMQYHCTSLASNGYTVTIVGYKGEKCRPEVEENDLISFQYIDTSVIQKLPVKNQLLLYDIHIIPDLSIIIYAALSISIVCGSKSDRPVLPIDLDNVIQSYITSHYSDTKPTYYPHLHVSMDGIQS